MLQRPVQARSQRTLETILDAVEDLLREKSFEKISVAEIILRSGSSTGSFYARFQSKDDLLPVLYARYDDELPARLSEIERSVRNHAVDLRALCRIIIDGFARSFEDRPNLMRALVLHARRDQTDLSPVLARRSKLLDAVGRLFEPFHNEIAHHGKSAAVRVGLFFAATTVREAVLFSSAPFAATTRIGTDDLKRAAVQALHSYLTAKD